MGSRGNDIDAAACAAAASACACFNLRRASRSASQFFDAMLQPSGLRSTQFVLLALIRADEPVAPARLATAMIADRSTLSRNLKPLVAEGLVVARESKGVRGTLLSLTQKGRRTLTKAVPLWGAAQGKFVEALGPREWDSLLPLLARAASAPPGS